MASAAKSNPLAPIPMIGNQPAWREILRANGYPTDVVVIDFENHFSADYTMEKMSTIEYVTDPRYEEIGHAIAHVRQPFEEPTPCFWFADGPNHIRHLQRQYGQHLDGCTVVMQNAAYDGLILAIKYGIHIPYCVDLLGLARHEESRHRNGLEFIAERLGLPPKGDTSQFKGLRLRRTIVRDAATGRPMIVPGMTGEQREAMSEYARHDAWLEWQGFIRYLPRLTNPGLELRLMQHTLELFWKPTLYADQGYAANLIEQMERRIEEVVRVTGHDRDTISGTTSFGGVLAAALDESGDSVKRYQKDGKPNRDGSPKKLLAIAKDDPQLGLLKVHTSQKVRDLLAARTAIKSWPLHIKRVKNIAAQAKPLGRLPVPLRYCGAHTGRWSGGEGINLQNLPSRSPEKLVNAMRGIIVPGPGQKLVVVDASQVEARGLSWIAGQDDLNQLFREGREIYCEYAGRMVGKKLRKSRKTDPDSVKRYLDRMRNMGKVQVLGCGYGMGADKCVDFAASTYSVTLTIPEADRLVRSYRESVPQITKFWRVVEQKFKAATRYNEVCTMDRGLSIFKDVPADTVCIQLPSRRILRYPKARVSIINGQERLWMPDPGKPGARIFMWGGYLTENIVQALCRDLLGEAIMQMEAVGHHVALHTHDEVVIPKDETNAEKTLADVIRIFSTPPAWAEGCPLAAEGQIVDRYTK